MLLSLFARRSGRPADPKPPAPLFFRPQLEGYEDRVVPAHLGPVGHTGPINISPHFDLNLIDINISDVRILSGQLVGDVTIGGVPVGDGPTVITPTLIEPTGDEECPVLNLELGPINLDLLGLNVDTSAICVRIAGDEGPGNLLGNLICGLTDGGDGGLLGAIGGLGAADQAALLGGVADILNGVFDRLTNQAAIAGVSGTGDDSGGDCDILNLAVGPLDLNLLGLDVEADDCTGENGELGGPITVDVTADPEGGLLGDLLCDLSGLLDSPGNRFGQIQNLLDRVGDAIEDILAANRP